MAEELIEKLRRATNPLMWAAADEIERLRAEVARATAVEDMWRAEALRAQQALVEARQK